MRYASENEINEIEKYMSIAAEEAKKSTCKKSQRGVVIVKDGKIIGRGYNKPTIEKLCNPCIREDIKDNSRVELCSAIHAEQMAILDALKKCHSLKGSRLYHVKVKNGEPKPSHAPSCTACSRLILEAEISEIVLWLKDGYVIYNAKEFNELSFRYFVKF